MMIPLNQFLILLTIALIVLGLGLYLTVRKSTSYTQPVDTRPLELKCCPRCEIYPVTTMSVCEHCGTELVKAHTGLEVIKEEHEQQQHTITS